MKILLCCFLLATLCACNSKPTITDNPELTQLYQADQADREDDDIDWRHVYQRDLQRRARVTELLDSNMVHTATDYHNAAMVFQHGEDSVA